MANLQNRLVKIEHGVPKVSQKLAEFMASCKAKQSTRYALNSVGVTEGVLVTTNGRTLLVVTPIDTFDPPITDGLYHLTGEGFLLKTDNDAAFPKWQESVPKNENSLGCFNISDPTSGGREKLCEAIIKAECRLNLTWLLAALKAFVGCGCDAVDVFDPGGNNPMLITGEGMGAKIQYIQMPMHIEP